MGEKNPVPPLNDCKREGNKVPPEHVRTQTIIKPSRNYKTIIKDEDSTHSIERK